MADIKYEIVEDTKTTSDIIIPTNKKVTLNLVFLLTFFILITCSFTLLLVLSSIYLLLNWLLLTNPVTSKNHLQQIKFSILPINLSEILQQFFKNFWWIKANIIPTRTSKSLL